MFAKCTWVTVARNAVKEYDNQVRGLDVITFHFCLSLCDINWIDRGKNEI